MDDTARSLDPVWRALSDPTRRSLLDQLRSGPVSTGELVARIGGMTRYGVMKHLAVLEEAGLITVRREGRTRYNQLNAVPLRRVYERWVSKYEDQWAGSLLALKRVVERRQKTETAMQSPATNSFVFEVSLKINAPPARVFDAWFDGCADWFYESEDARTWQRAVMEREVGGRFYMENTGGDKPGKINLLAIVTMIEPGRKLRLRGDFTMPHAMIANCTVTFEPSGTGCTVTAEHRMVGECDREMADGFAEGWQDGLEKLRSLVEAG